MAFPLYLLATVAMFKTVFYAALMACVLHVKLAITLINLMNVNNAINKIVCNAINSTVKNVYLIITLLLICAVRISIALIVLKIAQCVLNVMKSTIFQIMELVVKFMDASPVMLIYGAVKVAYQALTRDKIYVHAALIQIVCYAIKLAIVMNVILDIF